MCINPTIFDDAITWPHRLTSRRPVLLADGGCLRVIISEGSGREDGAEEDRYECGEGVRHARELVDVQRQRGAARRRLARQRHLATAACTTPAERGRARTLRSTQTRSAKKIQIANSTKTFLSCHLVWDRTEFYCRQFSYNHIH